jgi:hypothetical protein
VLLRHSTHQEEFDGFLDADSAFEITCDTH